MTPSHGLSRIFTPEEQEAIRDFEEAEHRWRFRYDEPKISPFNQGRWPTPEEIEARKEEIRQQLRKMKRENPKLYKRMPLLHDLIEGEADAP